MSQGLHLEDAPPITSVQRPCKLLPRPTNKTAAHTQLVRLLSDCIQTPAQDAKLRHRTIWHRTMGYMVQVAQRLHAKPKPE